MFLYFALGFVVVAFVAQNKAEKNKQSKKLRFGLITQRQQQQQQQQQVTLRSGVSRRVLASKRLSIKIMIQGQSATHVPGVLLFIIFRKTRTELLFCSPKICTKQIANIHTLAHSLARTHTHARLRTDARETARKRAPPRENS